MLQMRELSASRLDKGVEDAMDLLRRTIAFFGSELGVKEYDLVPYEAQLLAVAGFYVAAGEPSPAAVSQLAKWFWTSSLNEDMQGRSEHKVAHIVDTMKEIRAGKGELKGRLTLTTSSLKERRFRWGAALSSAFAAMLAKNSARSLVTGEVIVPAEYLGTEASAAFMSFANEKEVARAIGRDSGSAKVVANTIVTSKRERPLFRELGSQEVLSRLRSRSDATEILESQFISQTAADALVNGRISEFLECRARNILAYAATLSFPSSSVS
jgi:hypothetical protein